MEAILLVGALYGVWNIALQRHRKLNDHDQASIFDDPTGKQRYNTTEVAPYQYHPEQAQVNYGSVLGPRWEFFYRNRQARERRSTRVPFMDRSLYFQNGYMQTQRTRFVDEPVTPATHADFSDDGRGRLLKSESCAVNESLIAV